MTGVVGVDASLVQRSTQELRDAADALDASAATAPSSVDGGDASALLVDLLARACETALAVVGEVVALADAADASVDDLVGHDTAASAALAALVEGLG